MERRRALITGASSGIGECMAEQLAARGWDLVLVARRGDELARVAAAVSASGAAAEVIVADLSTSAGIESIEARIADERQPIEMVVNNAGYGRFGKITELDAAGESNEIFVNVNALMRLSRAALVSMAPRKRGAILNVASVASFLPFPGFTTYAATKAFVRSFTLALHEEARPYGVRVTCVAPGYTPSGFQERGGLSSTAGQPSFMLTSADFVARVALDAVESGRALVVPGLMNAISARILGLLPSGLQRRAGAFASKFTR
ncbi:MAG: SDR family NAD(P)-dependent oxidoreductase [Candidatus Limnocylindrus sp.]|jgi:short-subunit dehydrogenase